MAFKICTMWYCSFPNHLFYDTDHQHIWMTHENLPLQASPELWCPFRTEAQRGQDQNCPLILSVQFELPMAGFFRVHMALSMLVRCSQSLHLKARVLSISTNQAQFGYLSWTSRKWRTYSWWSPVKSQVELIFLCTEYNIIGRDKKRIQFSSATFNFHNKETIPVFFIRPFLTNNVDKFLHQKILIHTLSTIHPVCWKRQGSLDCLSRMWIVPTQHIDIQQVRQQHVPCHQVLVSYLNFWQKKSMAANFVGLGEIPISCSSSWLSWFTDGHEFQ